CRGEVKTECTRTTVFHPRPFRTLADVEFATAGWVDRYDNRRLHGSLGILAPVEFETLRYEVLTREPAPTKQRENPGRFRALAGHRLTARRRTTGCWTQDTLSVLAGCPDSVNRWTESGERFGVSSTGQRARRAHSGRATESDSGSQVRSAIPQRLRQPLRMGSEQLLRHRPSLLEREQRSG